MNTQQVLDQRLRHTGIGLIFLALLTIGIDLRNSNHTDWLLEPPMSLGSWSLTQTSLSEEFLGKLTHPKSLGFEYNNPLDEKITGQLISPHSFEAYREPDDFQKLHISAQRSVPLFGSDKPVRAWILKTERGEGRLLVYSWLQTPQGATYLYGTRGLHQSLLDRLYLSGTSLIRTEPQCLVRLYMLISPLDKNGIQARKSLDAIAKALYQSNRRSAS